MTWLLLSFAIFLGHSAQACTIIELDSSGFADNAYSLLHALPMFFRRNGTFFLDNSRFDYRCSKDGGWHDFFSGEENIVPWSRPKEVVHGENCARYSAHQIDEILHKIVQTKPEFLDFIGIKKAWRYRPWVQDLVDQQLEILAKQRQPTIGFYIRGANLVHHERGKKHGSSSPVDVVQTFAHAYPLIRGGTCVMVGDEPAQVTEAAQAAERHLRCKVLRTAPFQRNKDDPEDTKDKEASDVQCSGTVKMLIDMELLAHADYLVASDRSRWSRILQYMRYILYDKDRSSFVDASEDHTDLYSNIHRYIRPNSVTVIETGTRAQLPEGFGDAKGSQPADMRRPVKKARKNKRKAPRKHAAPPPPPPAPKEEPSEDYEYEYDDAA